MAALTVCRDHPDLRSCPFLYTGTNCVDVLLDHLDSEAFRLKCVYESVNEPCHWYNSQCLAHESAEQCSMCLRPFTSHRIKVLDHCHISGWYRFALCLHCNLTHAKRPFEVIVFFHGLSNYDSHFIVCKLAFCPLRWDIHVIPRNSERYLAFNYGCLHFKDSYQFLAESLATLVDNLRTKGTDRFRNLNRFVTRKCERDLMMSKGVFPYSYMTHPCVLLERRLPEKEKFYNDLTCSHVSDKRYAFAREVWDAFQCENLKDYLHVYLLADCLLLEDVFENYRDCCLADYRLDLVHYYSSPHFTFDAFLLFSRAKLDFLTEVDQYLFLNKAMWGGLSMVAKCHSKANHPSLTDYDSSRPCRFLMFLDVNNLYGKAMMDFLPVGGFKWMSQEELTVEFICGLPDEGKFGCFVDCMLFYPSALHDVHDDYPLAPMKRKVSYEDLSPHAKKMCDRLSTQAYT